MAPRKRPHPLAEPPSASSTSASSEDEMDLSEEIKQQDQRPNKQVAQSESESESEEEDQQDQGFEDADDEEEAEAEAEEEEVEEEKRKEPSPEESDSESDTQISPSAFTVMPIVSKPKPIPIPIPIPMEESPKSKKKPHQKRPAESEKSGKEPQKKRSKVSIGGDGVEEKRTAINRLWSEEDELAILRGVIEFHSSTGLEPSAAKDDFHKSIKKSLHVEVSTNQLMDKLRRLKKKYQDNVKKGGENGEDPVFTQRHDHKAFKLSKQIWGASAGTSAGAAGVDAMGNKNKKSSKSAKVSGYVVSSPKGKAKAKDNGKENNGKEFASGEEEGLKGGEGKEVKSDEVDYKSTFLRQFMDDSLEMKFSAGFLSMAVPNFLKDLVKERMEERLGEITNEMAKELVERQMNLRRDEVAIYLKRVEYMQDMTKLFMV